MDEKARSIRFPQGLWDRIDRDAERCKRSANKHLEAVLEMYYRLTESVDLNLLAMNEVRAKLDDNIPSANKDVLSDKMTPVVGKGKITSGKTKRKQQTG